MKPIYQSVTAGLNPDGSPSIIAWRGRTFDTIPLSDGKGGTIRKVSAVDPKHLAALVTAARAVDRADTYIHERPAALAGLRAALAPFTTDPAPVSPPEPEKAPEPRFALLSPGDTMQEGDEHYCPRDMAWLPVVAFRDPFDPEIHRPVRRAVKA